MSRPAVCQGHVTHPARDVTGLPRHPLRSLSRVRSARIVATSPSPPLPLPRCRRPTDWRPRDVVCHHRELPTHTSSPSRNQRRHFWRKQGTTAPFVSQPRRFYHCYRKTRRDDWGSRCETAQLSSIQLSVQITSLRHILPAAKEFRAGRTQCYRTMIIVST